MTHAVGTGAAPPQLFETAPRRRLQAELGRIQDQCHQSGLHDPLTEEIRNWQEQFWQQLRLNADVNAVHGEFIQLLHKLLKNPPPFGPDAPDPTSHPIVGEMIRWLKSHDALLHSPEMEEHYRALIAQRDPAPQQAQRGPHRLRERLAQRRQRETEEKEARKREMRQEVQQQLAPLYTRMEQSEQERITTLHTLAERDAQEAAVLHARFDALWRATAEEERAMRALAAQTARMQRTLERTCRLQNTMGRVVDELHTLKEREIELIREAEESNEVLEQRLSAALGRALKDREAIARGIEERRLRDQSEAQAVRARIQELQQERAAFDAEIQELNSQNERTQRAVDETVKQDAHLRISIQEVARERREREGGWMSGVEGALCAIALCAFTTWIFQSLLAASGSSLKGLITPLRGSGAQAGLFFSL
jgi:hypothetical protein